MTRAQRITRWRYERRLVLLKLARIERQIRELSATEHPGRARTSKRTERR